MLKIYKVNAIISRYKIPFLIALVVALGIIVVGSVGYWLTAVFIFAGAILGILFLDLEYAMNAYIVDPDDDKSGIIKEFFRKKNIAGYFDYINNHEYEFDKLTIRTVLVQVIFWIFIFYVVNGAGNAFALAFTLSVGANMLYQQALELLKTKTLRRWFWMYNGVIQDSFYYVYLVGMLLTFVLMIFYV